jgi:hypothetical protein
MNYPYNAIFGRGLLNTFEAALHSLYLCLKVLAALGVPDKAMMIFQDLSSSEEVEMLSFLEKNSDVFACQTSDLIGFNRDIIEHKLQVKPSAKLKKQKLYKMSDEKMAVTKVEV